MDTVACKTAFTFCTRALSFKATSCKGPLPQESQSSLTKKLVARPGYFANEAQFKGSLNNLIFSHTYGCGGCGTAFARARSLRLPFHQSYGKGYEVRMINPEVTLPTLHTFGHETLSIWGVDKGNGQV